MSLLNAIVLDKLFDELRSGPITEPGMNHGRGKEYKPLLRYKVQPVHNYLWEGLVVEILLEVGKLHHLKF